VELHADFNTPVKLGQLLAKLDTELLEARLSSARADHASAKAQVEMQRAQIERSHAEVENARAAVANMRAQVDRASSQLRDAETDRQRKEQLARAGVTTQAELERSTNADRQARAGLAAAEAQRDASIAAERSAEAQLKVAGAQLDNLKASVLQRQAAVEQVEVDLRRSIIRSPIDGVIVQRAIDVGQTVAASLQAPTLFTIAQDLRRMQVEATIDEADIGRVRDNMDVDFTVTAHPNRRFRGTVSQVRLAPINISNVITYTVVISADNADRLLLPGMTATVTIVTDRRENVLKVPVAALRYRPPGSPASQPAAGQGGEDGSTQAAAASNPQAAAAERAAQAEAIRKALIEQLKLTKDQIAEYDRIAGEARQEFQKLFVGGAAAEERRVRGRQIREAAAEKIMAMLNAEQKPKYAAMRAEAAQRAAASAGSGTQAGTLYTVGDDNMPKVQRIRIGATDGSSVEVIGASLRDGQEVIVGGGPRPAAPASAGPRLGF